MTDQLLRQDIDFHRIITNQLESGANSHLIEPDLAPGRHRLGNRFHHANCFTGFRSRYGRLRLALQKIEKLLPFPFFVGFYRNCLLNPLPIEVGPQLVSVGEQHSVFAGDLEHVL